MKTIVTLDKGNQPYGFAQLDANANLNGSVTASYALTASYAMNGGNGGTIDTGSFVTNSQTGSFATTGSNTFTGLQIITGSNGVLRYSGTDANTGNPGYPSLADIHANDAQPWLERFYNDTFSTSDAVMAYFGWDDGRFVFHNESTQSIGIQVNSYDGTTGLLVYEDKVAFVNNIEVSGSANISGTLSQGFVVTATGNYSHAEGGGTQATGNYSHAEGFNSIASGLVSHAEGDNTLASGVASHAEGNSTTGSGDGSHAEGISTKAIGYYSHTEGYVTIATGYAAHAEGSTTNAIGAASHAEGVLTTTIGIGSHAEGIGTIASGSGQHVSGKYNLHNNTSSLFIIGNGVDDSNRSDVVRVEIEGVQITGSLNITGESNFNDAVAVNDSNMNLTNSSSLNLTSGSSVYIDGGLVNVSTGSINVTAPFHLELVDTNSTLVTTPPDVPIGIAEYGNSFIYTIEYGTNELNVYSADGTLTHLVTNYDVGADVLNSGNGAFQILINPNDGIIYILFDNGVMGAWQFNGTDAITFLAQYVAIFNKGQQGCFIDGYLYVTAADSSAAAQTLLVLKLWYQSPAGWRIDDFAILSGGANQFPQFELYNSLLFLGGYLYSIAAAIGYGTSGIYRFTIADAEEVVEEQVPSRKVITYQNGYSTGDIGPVIATDGNYIYTSAPSQGYLKVINTAEWNYGTQPLVSLDLRSEFYDGIGMIKCYDGYIWISSGTISTIGYSNKLIAYTFDGTTFTKSIERICENDYPVDIVKSNDKYFVLGSKLYESNIQTVYEEAVTVLGNVMVTGSIDVSGSITQNGYEVKPYKVYTALLTQTGGDDSQTITSGAVTQSFTYYIDGADTDSDFSNVGGPIGTVGDGTYFVATNSAVPNNYGAANITYNNGAPRATALENTIGNIWWTYGSTGEYNANSSNLFTDNKTIGQTNQISDDNNTMYLYEAYQSNTSYCTIITSDGSSGINGLLGNGNKAWIEIRVYN